MRLEITPAEGPPFDRLLQEESLVIGRASTSDLVLADPFLSRHHARLFHKDGELMIEDLGSRNGTQLNKVDIVGPTVVRSGDVVRVSGSQISFFDDSASSDDQQRSDLGATILRSASELLRDSDTGVAPDLVEGEVALRAYANRLKRINEIHEGLSRSLHSEELLELILERAFELLRPEQGVIFLRDPRGEYQRAASRGGVDSKAPLSRALIEQVCVKGMALVALDAASDERFAGAESIIMSGMRSLVAAPLLDAEGSLGMIVLSSRAAQREFSAEDMQFLVSLASIAALKLRNVALTVEAVERRKLDADLALARRIQESLLPAGLPVVPGFELFALNVPSRGVSGDYFQVVSRAGGAECALLIADVSGKGIPAAIVTASLEALTTGPIEDGLDPAEIFRVVSRRLFRRTPPEKYATAFLCVVDVASGALTYTNAGHNPAILVRATGESQHLAASGMPLGLVVSADYSSDRATLGPGDTLVIYTDGITETENQDEEQYGLDRLDGLVREHRHLDPSALGAEINRDLEQFAAGVPVADDRTFIVAKRAG